jgi:hypothetical protein
MALALSSLVKVVENEGDGPSHVYNIVQVRFTFQV